MSPRGPVGRRAAWGVMAAWAVFAWGGCGAQGGSAGQEDAGASGDASGDAPGGAETDAAAAPGGWAGMAVVCSDYSSTSVALVDPSGRVVTTPTLIHSGSLPPGVMPALGGDVDLPTSPSPDGSVLLLDRTPSAVLTFVDPASGAVTRQVSVATGFASNPHDALVVGPGDAGAGDPLAAVGLAPGSILVTRYDPNPSAGPGAAGVDGAGLDVGDDLLLVGPDGAPVAALPFTEADGFPGRPDRLVAVGPGLVWVSLNRVSRDWQTYREGAVAAVRVSGGSAPALEERERLAVAGLRNCGALAPWRAAGAEGDGVAAVALACGGSWRVGTRSFAQDESAVVWWEVDPAGSGAERARLSASDLPPDLAGRTFGPGLAVLPGGAVVVTVYGAEGAGPGAPARGDAALLWEPGTGRVTTLLTTESPWTLWAAQAAADGAALLPVSDDLDPRLCRVESGPEGPRASCLAACASTGLPPRAVRPFGP